MSAPKTYDNNYSTAGKKKRYNPAEKLLLSSAFLVCLWGASLAGQYYFKNNLDKWSVYNPDIAYPLLKKIFPVPACCKYIEVKPQTDFFYEINLLSGGSILSKELKEEKDTIIIRDHSGMKITLNKDQIKSLRKKKE